ncbi:MAG: class I SAM-dependent DNA methyltransferase [Thermoplasmatales archaeon]
MDRGNHSLENWLWEAACSIRGEIEAPKYKDFILPLVFIKRLSDVFEDELKALSDDLSISEQLVNSDHSLVRFYIPEKARWSNIIKQVSSIGEYLTDAMRLLARENPQLQGVVDTVDFNQSTAGVRTIYDDSLKKLIQILDTKRLGLNDVDPDVLGRAYEYLLRKFAEGSGQSAGEFYTPMEVAQLMALILDPMEGEEIYDPSCGTGGLLIKSNSVFKDKYSGKEGLNYPKFFGQEINKSTYAMAKMNAIIHDMQDSEIAIGDTMLRPGFKNEDGSLRKFDKVVANPMWNQKFDQSVYKNDPYGRFTFGYPPNNSADWGWIQHMLFSSKKRVVVVLDQGSLFRGGSEGKIRKGVIEKDLIESVISLPEKLFYNTGAPASIIVLNKSKDENRKGRILFINASNEFGKHKEVRRLNQLYPEHIEKIVNAFRSFSNSEGFSSVRSIEDVEKNNGNLNVTLYVPPVTKEEQVDIRNVLSEISKVDNELKEVDEKLNKYLKELGYID